MQSLCGLGQHADEVVGVEHGVRGRRTKYPTGLRDIYACREMRPVALCGIARLVSSTLRLPADPFSGVSPTHASMLEMLSTKRPSVDYSSHFDEVTGIGSAPDEDDVLEDLKSDVVTPDVGVYDNLVRCTQSVLVNCGPRREKRAAELHTV